MANGARQAAGAKTARRRERWSRTQQAARLYQEERGGMAYDAADEAALKTTLDAIAAEIKTWGEYEEAKNVTE